jgi:hypothetical protein
MGTRGMLGFVVDGEKEIITYNHFDSYPSGLGADVAEWIASVDDWEAIRQQARDLTPVDEESKPTEDELAKLSRWHNSMVSEGDDWYSLLRGTQGKPGEILDCGYWVPNNGFVSDSLFCEWGYFIDLDTATFEVYRGFQRSPHESGRFAGRVRSKEPLEYYPIKLVGSSSLGSSAKRLIDEVEAAERAEYEND